MPTHPRTHTPTHPLTHPHAILQAAAALNPISHPHILSVTGVCHGDRILDQPSPTNPCVHRPSLRRAEPTMSGLEALAIITAVAAVVSAFNDGNTLVRQIKDKQSARKAPLPPQSLEESLELGPVDIEAQTDNGLRDFGQEFANGDRMSDRAFPIKQALTLR